MKLNIQHVTHYDYSAPLQYALQSLCLTPQASAHQTVHEWAVSAPAPLHAQRDGYGNLAHTWSLARRSYGSAVRAAGTVETHASPWLVDGGTPNQLYLRSTPLTAADEQLKALGRVHLADGVNEASAMALAQAVLKRVRYKPGSTHVRTTALEAWELGGGVCQDHAHVYLAACRANGVAARYVSGYFYAPDAPHLASHAWVDVCVEPSAHRWLSVDITHGCLMDERHVRLAVGLDYAACSPIRGVREGGGEETMRVRIDIRQAGEPPVPKPPAPIIFSQQQTQSPEP